MQNIIMHPIDENPLIQAYQIRNFELSILSAHNRNITPWLLNKHINCIYNEKVPEVLFDHTVYEERWYKLEGVTDVYKMRFKKSINKFECINMLDIAREMIANEYYFMGYFDEYYISCKNAYNNFHFRHTALIYGYNDDEEIFYAIGYTANRKYEKYIFKYDEFIKSIEVNYDKNKYYHKKDIERVEYDFIKINKNFEFKINITDICNNLYDYIHSLNSKEKKRTGLIYGIDSEKKFIEYMEKVKTGNGICDERFSRFFMELKDLMKLRIEYLESNGYITPGVMPGYGKIVDSQRIIHNLFLKFNASKQQAIIDKAIKYQEEIINTEYKILPQLLDELYKYLQNEHLKKYK